MKHSILAAAASFCLLAPGAVFAQGYTGSEPPPAMPAVSNVSPQDQVICKYYYFNGRTLSRRYCLTAHQWERVRLSTQQAIVDFQHHGLLQAN